MKFIADRITVDENLCNGKPTVRGHRLTVQTVLEFLSAGESESELLSQYPFLEEQDIRACLKFASEMMNRFSTQPTAA